MRMRTFGQAFGALVVFWLVMEVFYGFARNPLDDRWTGDVNVVNLFTPTKLDATMTMDMLDPGFVMNLRPDVRVAGVRFAFDGPQSDALRKLGISEELFVSPERWKYTQGFCTFHSEKNLGSHASEFLGVHTNHLAALRYTTNGNVCDTFEIGVVDFDHINFEIVRPGEGRYSTGGISLKDVVSVELKRDSRVSFIQRLIMRARFSSWVDDASFKKEA